MQKLNKVQEKGYIGPGTVKSKGLEDIHMVYDGTKCGLNSVIWTPWFSFISNVSRYSPVNLNLPGTVDYRPYLPWVFKTHSEGMLACDLFIYVDDSHTTGPTEEECWAASRQYGYTITYLGLQDAARKHREPSTDPGPWAGSIVKAKDDVYVLISQERWDKVKGMLQWLRLSLDYGLPIDQKTLESYRGYLVYISQTYPFITPFLKGIHLTLDSWRPWRKSMGGK